MKKASDIIAPFTWLIGNWSGNGSGSFPTMDTFSYRDNMKFKLLKEDFSKESIIHFEEIGWINIDQQEYFKHWETGYLKPGTDDSIDLRVVHNTGRMEIYRGRFEHFDKKAKSFRIKFRSEFLWNGLDLKTALKAIRTFDFAKGQLKYRLEMSTVDVKNPENHLEAVLVKTL